MRAFAVVAVVVASLVLTPAPTHAQACAAGMVPQGDMAGTYVSPEELMRVELYACGGAYVQWDNAYGTHSAAYGAIGRLPGGGVVGEVLPVTAVPLDGSRKIGFKPAEPGYIQVITLGVYDETYRTYRLKKI